MIESRWTKKDELVEILMDLKHDLGKYMFLHLSHLTQDSPPDMVNEALHTALYETRTVSGVTQSAEQIWQRYKNELALLDYSFDGHARLISAVEAALSMQQFLSRSNERPIHVRQIQKIARQISETISQLILEVQGDN